MSRSKKKTPIRGTTIAESEKDDKRIWHKRFRRTIKNFIRKFHGNADELQDEVLPDIHNLSDPWSMSKDGKTYWRDAEEKDMRK